MAAQQDNQQNQGQQTNQAPAGNVPPPPPQQSPAPQQSQVGSDVQGQAQAPPPPKRKFPKKILFIIGGLLLAGILGFGVYRFVLPMFGGVAGNEVVWWGLWEDESIVEPIIAEYESQNPGVTVTYINQSKEDYRERLTNAMARGEGPDIFRFHNTWVPMFRQELDAMPTSVMTAADFTQSFYPVATSDLSSGTGIVGIPLMYDGLTLFINEDIFTENEKNAPRTWDDLRQTAIELTTKDERDVITQAGVALGRTENVDHWEEILGLMMLQNGANPANPTSALAEDAVRFFTVFSNVDEVWDETLPPSTTAFAAGKVAMYFGPSWRAFEIRRQNPELNFRTEPLPQLPKTNPDEPDTAYATYWAEGVWTRSENKEEAWKFLSHLSQRETLEKLYQNASQTRQFGEPYPRVDMAGLLSDHPILGSVISQAPDAQSWYLASRTFDGPTGINSQISSYYEDAINAINQGTQASSALETAAQGMNQVLSQFGIGR